MYIHFSGMDYFLDEKKFREMIAAAGPPPPLNMEEVIAIQQRMREMEVDFMEHLEMTAMPVPHRELQRYLDGLIAGD